MTKSSQPSRNTSSQSKLEKIKQVHEAIPSAIAEVNRILEDHGFQPELKEFVLEPKTKEEAIKIIEHIFHNFHRVATTRKENKTLVFDVENEKKTQDLINGLLRLHFNDIRKEEETPSTAAGSTNIDFLLPNPNIGIEVKMGYVGNTELRKQINDDKGCYGQHTQCKLLMVFVYDPKHEVENPPAFEKQLSQKTTKLETKIYVLPKP